MANKCVEKPAKSLTTVPATTDAVKKASSTVTNRSKASSPSASASASKNRKLPPDVASVGTSPSPPRKKRVVLPVPKEFSPMKKVKIRTMEYMEAYSPDIDPSARSALKERTGAVTRSELSTLVDESRIRRDSTISQVRDSIYTTKGGVKRKKQASTVWCIATLCISSAMICVAIGVLIYFNAFYDESDEQHSSTVQQ